MPRPTKRAKAGRINHYKKYTKNSQTDWTCPNSFEAVAIKKNVSILREDIIPDLPALFGAWSKFDDFDSFQYRKNGEVGDSQLFSEFLTAWRERLKMLEQGGITIPSNLLALKLLSQSALQPEEVEKIISGLDYKIYTPQSDIISAVSAGLLKHYEGSTIATDTAKPEPFISDERADSPQNVIDDDNFMDDFEFLDNLDEEMVNEDDKELTGINEGEIKLELDDSVNNQEDVVIALDNALENVSKIEEKDVAVVVAPSIDIDGVDDNVKKMEEKVIASATTPPPPSISSQSQPPPPPIACEMCQEVYANANAMNVHLRETHSVSLVDFQCHVCQAILESAAFLGNHYTRLHALRIYKCEECGKSFATINLLNNHQRVHERERNALASFTGSCPQCNKPMANMEAQKRHLKRHCRLVFNCTKCDTVCLSKEELLVHKRTHYVEATCTLCNKSFANEESLKVHNTKNHQQTAEDLGEDFAGVVYPCQECNEVFIVQSLLDKHVSNEHTLHECGECGKVFMTARKLKRHHQEVHTRDRSFVGHCPRCDKVFTTPLSLKDHIRRGTCVLPTCGQCGEECASKEELRIHKRTHFVEAVCVTCNKTFAHVGQLKGHYTKHHAAKNFKCDQCGAEFPTARQLASHNTLLHAEKQFKCDECGSDHATEALLRSHIRVHDRTREYKCDKCGEEFTGKNSQNNFNRHMLKHGEYGCKRCKQYFSCQESLDKHVAKHVDLKCQECDLTFTKEHQYRRHMNLVMHGGERSFQCDQCEKSYISMWHLKKHIFCAHTSERPFECKTCGKRFSLKKGLEKHERIHTGARPYSCHLCDKTFVQSGDKSRHMKRHREMDQQPDQS